MSAGYEDWRADKLTRYWARRYEGDILAAMRAAGLPRTLESVEAVATVMRDDMLLHRDRDLPALVAALCVWLDLQKR